VLVSLLVCIRLSKFTVGTNFSTMSYGQYPIKYWIAILCGGFSIVLLFYLIKDSKIIRNNKLFQFCGRNSLILLLTHSAFKLPQLSWLIVEKVFGSRGSGLEQNLKGILCLIVMLIIEIPIVSLFKKGFLKKIFKQV